MIPLRDINRSEHFPLANVTIIILNVLAFIWQLSQGPHIQQSLYLYGIVPIRYSNPAVSVDFTAFQQILPFATSMFLHGGFLHLIGNMWFLYIFGDNIEDRLGHFRYLVFYLLCGIVAGLIHLVTNWGSQIPTIGASGAIAGVMGGYLLLYPRARILTLIPIFIFPYFVEIPAYIFLGFWFFIQLFSAGATSADVGGVAFWAHVGGFACGLALVKLFARIPSTGLSDSLRRRTERRTSPRLQPLTPQYSSEEPDSEATIAITPREARFGTRKMISVPQGMRRRALVVTIPPGMEEGMRLRLKGLGKLDPNGNRGDLYLRLRVTG
jgi:membrane associated rhomboid family serine protease